MPETLPPYNAVTGRYMTKTGHYTAYRKWRKSVGYKLWLKDQWKIQKGKCYYCKVSLKGRRHNVEHVLAQRYWGETSRKNMVLSCPDCNRAKGSKKVTKLVRRQASEYNYKKRRKKRII